MKFIEERQARASYDFALDTLSPEWNPVRALRAARGHPDAEIADVLLDQGIFAGVGNIIKNEVLFRTSTHPRTAVRDIPTRQLKAIVADARVFSERFLSCDGGSRSGRTSRFTDGVSARGAAVV